MSFLCGCFGEPSRANKVHSDHSHPHSHARDSKNQVSKPKNIVIVGPAGSGKTTLVHQLIEKKIILPPPSPLVEQYKIVLNDCPMIIYDVPGNSSVEEFTTGLFAVIFVVDWSDELKRCLATENLAQLVFTNENVRRVPMLVVVNKVDNTLAHDDDHDNDKHHYQHPHPHPHPHPHTHQQYQPHYQQQYHPPRLVSASRAGQMLGLSVVPHSHMSVVCCSATAGWGIPEVLSWLHQVASQPTASSVSSMHSLQKDSLVW